MGAWTTKRRFVAIRMFSSSEHRKRLVICTCSLDAVINSEAPPSICGDLLIYVRRIKILNYYLVRRQAHTYIELVTGSRTHQLCGPRLEESSDLAQVAFFLSYY
jgi:hypothetical protein